VDDAVDKPSADVAEDMHGKKRNSAKERQEEREEKVTRYFDQEWVCVACIALGLVRPINRRVRGACRSDNCQATGARRARQHRVSGERTRAKCRRARARPYDLSVGATSRQEMLLRVGHSQRGVSDHLVAGVIAPAVRSRGRSRHVSYGDACRATRGCDPRSQRSLRALRERKALRRRCLRRYSHRPFSSQPLERRCDRERI